MSGNDFISFNYLEKNPFRTNIHSEQLLFKNYRDFMYEIQHQMTLSEAWNEMNRADNELKNALEK